MKSYSVLLALLALAGLSSCQKVIDVDLNGSDPRYIVEGNITDAPGADTVKITRSANFSSGNAFPAVTGALVVVTDVTAGTADTLKESTPGSYYTTHITGVPEHTYSLYISADGNVFTAASTMPLPVPLDTVEIQKSVFGGTDLYPVPVYRDPAGIRNRYRLNAAVNRKPIKDWDVRSDNVTDGQTARFPFYYDTDDDSGNPVIKAGDTVAVTLQTIDSAVYEFYRTLQDTRDQNAAALSNPLTNLKGGAMGYFSAGAVSTKRTIAK